MNNNPCNCNKKQEKHSLKEKKDNTINSLFEVEQFLQNAKKALKCINLYKFFK